MFARQFGPAIISAIGLGLSDIADTVVVGQKMGVTGIAAISLCLPIFMIINVIMHGLGIGGSVKFATFLAEGKQKNAKKIYKSTLIVSIGVSIILMIVGNLFLPNLLVVLGTSVEDGLLFELTYNYVRIILYGMPLFFLSYIMNYFLRNDDLEKIAGIGFTVGNICDLILNIIFVIFLDWGVVGAAYATLIGQGISIIIYLFAIYNNDNLKFNLIKPDLALILDSFKLGFATSSQYLFLMLFILISNNYLMNLMGSVGVAIFDVVLNVSFIIYYLYEGTAKAAQPIISTYYGEKNLEGMKGICAISIKWGSVLGGIGIMLLIVFSNTVCKIFGINNAQEILQGSYALRIFAIGAIFGGINILLESYFQSSNREKISFLIAILRGAVILLPVTMILLGFGIKYFWFLFPITEILTIIVSVIYYINTNTSKIDFDSKRIYNKVIRSGEVELGGIIAEINVFCESWEALPNQAYYVNMTIEELCGAIINNGFNIEEGLFEITLIANKSNEFELHIRDNAISFNPFSLEVKEVSDEDDYDMNAMGVFVIKNKAKEFFYRRYQGFNVLVVKI